MTSQSHQPSGSQDQRPDMVEELKQDGSRLADNATSRARQEAESRKNEAAHLAGSASSAFEKAAQELRDNAEVPGWMASALQQAARSIEGFATHIEGRSVDQLGREVSDFARRNPGTFLAASAAVGFVTSRVLRAGVDKKRHAESEEAHGGQSDRESSGDFAGWPADEYVKPTADGSYAPAFIGGEADVEGAPR